MGSLGNAVALRAVSRRFDCGFVWECCDKNVRFVERAQAKLGRRRCGRLSQSGFRRGAVWGSLGFVVAACVVARRFDCRFMEVC